MNIEPLSSETARELIKLPKNSMKNPFIASISLAGGINFFLVQRWKVNDHMVKI